MSTQKQDEIKSLVEAEFNRLNDEIVELEEERDGLRVELDTANDRISELESQVTELDDFREGPFIIKTGRDEGIQYSASNLLDQQIMEALSELIETSNNVALLQHLESLKKLGV